MRLKPLKQWNQLQKHTEESSELVPSQSQESQENPSSSSSSSSFPNSREKPPSSKGLSPLVLSGYEVSGQIHEKGLKRECSGTSMCTLNIGEQVSNFPNSKKKFNRNLRFSISNRVNNQSIFSQLSKHHQNHQRNSGRPLKPSMKPSIYEREKKKKPKSEIRTPNWEAEGN